MNKSGLKEQIDDAVFNGIKRTINRFRENPFYYFTESDIHSSLFRDIISGNSDLFYQRINCKKDNKNETFGISFMHHEYPTFFRYEKSFLGKEYYFLNDNIKKTFPDNSEKHGDRGNYDLTVLDPNIDNCKDINNFLRIIINKDISTKSYNIVKPLYFIEVKFLHQFNYTNKI